MLLKLKPLKACAEPAEMLISDSEGKKVALKNLLVGEVWHASGQSNMEWFAAKSFCSGLVQELARAKEDVPVREFRADTESALYPQRKVTSEAGWKTSRVAGSFSALALAFAHQLHQELKVPVGIVLTSHSNTRIEAFAERRAIEAHPRLRVDADMIHDGDAGTEQGRAAFEKHYRDLETWQKAPAELGFPVERPLKRPDLPGIAGQWRGPSQFFNGKIAPVAPFAIRGSIWCQGESNSGDGRIYAARMEALVQGWREAWDMPDMPFYFTQLQAYGAADSVEVGFAAIRQVQHLFFMNNRSHVGMVVQTDLNPAAPGKIHYQNKLHPGMRLARRALAKDYGRDIAYTGPIYENYGIEGNKAVVSFEKGSLFGGLMVGSKGHEKELKYPGKFVEPARPTPGEKPNHFRLCGRDRKWHAADAVIVGDTVVVTSKDVPEPVGVQYAYSAAPQNANLYNQAGLPATPFAAIDGNRPGIPQGFVTMSSGQGAQMASPLSWTSYAGVKDATQPAFRPRLDALLLQDPSSEVARKATAEYVKAVKECVATIIDRAKNGADMSEAPLRFPAFPEPGRNGDLKPDTVPTIAYNWCVSPLTPMAVAGVIWVPGNANLGYTPADFAAELEIHAKSLPATFGQDQVRFLYAQPSATLVNGITTPAIPNAKAVTFDAWPKSLKNIASGMAKAAK